LTPRRFAVYIPPNLGKFSFRSADRPLRPEVNARQRDAPSGAKMFGYSSIIRMATLETMI